jgi:hypothetical protein
MTLIGFLLKVALLIASWIQKIKLERARKKSSKQQSDGHFNI